MIRANAMVSAMKTEREDINPPKWRSGSRLLKEGNALISQGNRADKQVRRGVRLLCYR